MAPVPPPVRSLLRSELPAAGQVLGRAFAEDPVWSWLVRNKAQAAERIGRAMTLSIALHLDTCDVIGPVDDPKGVAACAQWSPPDHWRLPNSAYVRIGPRFISALGLSSVTKIPGLNATDKVHPAEPHWYLATLGTDPGHQGQGLASALLERRLAVCDDQLIPAYLESSRFENIVFYERHGFAVRDELTLAQGGPKVWTMWRDPQPERAGGTDSAGL